jgi:phage shock protein A
VREPNPLEALLERLRAQAGSALPEPLERMIRSLLEPFALIPQDELDGLQRQLDTANDQLAALNARVRTLEQDAARRAEKKNKKKNKGAEGKKRKG